jgi:hypothetical protein
MICPVTEYFICAYSEKEDARACRILARASFSFQYRKQMRQTMNRTDYRGRDNMPTCGCRQQHTPMPIPARPCHGEMTAVQTPCAQSGHGTHALAMAYVEIQRPGTLYDPCTALIAGTVFPDLDMPFCGETVSASAYPTPPARTCSCAVPARREHGGCGCVRGGDDHDD